MANLKSGLLVGACVAACTAPAVLPLLAGITLAGTGMALAGELGLAALVLAVGGGVYLWRRRPAARAACGCAAGSGCESGQGGQRGPGRHDPC